MMGVRAMNWCFPLLMIGTCLLYDLVWIVNDSLRDWYSKARQLNDWYSKALADVFSIRWIIDALLNFAQIW
jgi:hypothetical protein